MNCRLLMITFVALWLTGCQASHLVYVHNSSAGVEIKPVGEGTIKLVVGYDRETYAMVPTYVTEDSDDNAINEAMSLTAVSRTFIRGLNEFKFGHVVATGNVAKDVAKDGAGLKEVAGKVFND